ncbi:MAG TPA: SRPBCC family protein, partial [Candidatus Manganitrophaceae bacterium]|nr:SRPBCC family protein [Candidatus Manganitrophaceae bacterium]
SEWISRLTREEVTDEILTARIRSKLGTVVSHPGSITVRVDRGHVSLSGPILSREVTRLLAGIRAVRGVVALEDQLEVHSQAYGIPGLQGEGKIPEGVIKEEWSPAARFLGGAAGAALALYGARREGIFAAAVGTFGLGLMVRGVTNMPMSRLVGMGAGPRAVDIQKTIEIAAPVEQVFAFWNNNENFPRFMKNVRKVENLEEGRSRWTMAGPIGLSIEWEAAITDKRTNELLAWRSMPGAIIEHAGAVRFRPTPQGGTEIEVNLSYNPPAGALGRLAANLFGSDPKTELDEELARMKSLIETGKLPEEAAA